MATTTTDQKKAAKAASKKATGKVHLFVLMDESGSMGGKEEAVVTGCNEFLHAFKDNKEARAWLATFDHHPGQPRTRFKLKHEKMKDVSDLTMSDYKPRGVTPLNDAILESLDALDKKVKKDETVFMAIITDGLENASESSTEDVKKAIATYEKKGWGFVYLGANQHAETTAAKLGLVGAGKAFNFNATKGGVKSTMRNAAGLGQFRSVAGAGAQGLAAYEQQAAALYTQTGGKFEDDPEDD